jgi:NitT/TauT family transport system ATP-binding protein
VREGTDAGLSRTGALTARLANVSVTFADGTVALEAIDLDLRRGEFVALVGPSGCGKSTLLRLLAGFEQATAGSVATDGSPLGYVFQDATLLPWRDVLGNVMLPAALAGVPKRQAVDDARTAIRRVGLGGFERHRPAQLSGGMRMRVSIARALTLKPQLFLFDEPFGALDEITRERLNEELSSLFVLEPFAGLFVTHSVPESVYLSTRVVVLSGRPGRIVAEIDVPFGYPRLPELRYTTEFAALARDVSHALRQTSQAAA